ncbi:MAG: AAA family ATPase, partial [Deltaproteobacteria bacterium]|nr:AAA family ATPase [Deltaproteobacteria bacterium]
MEDEKFSPTIIRTKLHLPPIQKGHLHRRRLLDRLDEHLQRPLTLISAPAGYGKTTLASCWLETSDDLSAWVTLDEGDNDLRLFLSYFLTAIQTIFPNMGRQTLAMVNVAMIAPVKAIVGSLINEIDRIEQPFILVLDDSHLIKDESVLEVLNQLLRHPPQSMHLVLIGRRDPPLPISSLRAKGLLTEIRTQDLRFSEMETATFLTQELGTQVDLATVAALEEKTEGWVTGLRLAVLSMRHRDVIDQKLLEPHVDAQYVMEYLFTEVFSQQPPEISQYLLNTAILDRFCGPLCEALCKHGVESFTGKIGGWEFIAWLKKENMFLIPLDAENRWFRYHHLFQKLLVNQIKRHQGPEKINDLHAQAGAWLAENGIIEEALQHYLAAEDIPSAMQLVAQHGHNLMNNQQWPDLERLIGMLPRDRVEQDPELLIFKAWHKHVQTSGCDLPTKVAYNEKIEPLLNNLSEKALARETQINGHFEALRGVEFYLSADGENALKYSQSACDKIPMHHKRARVS